ncbi:MAG: Cation transporter-like protein MgtE2 [Candidatus Methanohalarchaeum thermophilum]|uniref:Cation transporter-like protein MgtE2 n=1 Tax=Methanohalarchaeum thermophilum TaxID=1903181 RepID=A0A1Q6DU84_METT1|nr:MAG: Cation transporter-like protein MgtE2 [Candidatus Methanohalarchaeum thermophilum]
MQETDIRETTPNEIEKDNLKKIIKQTFPLLFISLIGSLFAGLILGGMEETLKTIPGLIVVVPAVLDMRGNIYGALGSRLSTGLHQGLIEPKLIYERNLIVAISAALFNGGVVSIVLGASAYLTLNILKIKVISLFELIAITFLSGITSGLILTVIVLISLFIGFKKGIDPDNLVGPVVTVSGDIFSILILFLVAKLIIGGI